MIKKYGYNFVDEKYIPFFQRIEIERTERKIEKQAIKELERVINIDKIRQWVK